MVAAPSLNVTAPVALIGVTVAVRVTGCPAAAGFGVAARLVVVELVASLITSVTEAEVLGPYVLSPLYDAVSVWLPLARVAVLKLADPPVRTTALSVVAPSLKVTVPVAAAGVTVAVRVTICPTAAELGVTSKLIVAGFVAGLITSVTVADVLALLMESPLYDAVSVWLPTARLDVTIAPTPLNIATLPRAAAPSLNVTVPVAVVGSTTALRLTCCPALAGLGRAAMPTVVVAFPPPAPTVSGTAAEVLPL
jgi:hypothetical protein